MGKGERQRRGWGTRGRGLAHQTAPVDPLEGALRGPREPLLPTDTPLSGGYLVGRIQSLDQDREPIFGAIIEVQGRTVLSSFDGRFKLPLKGLTMPLTVHIRAAGYWRSTETLSLTHTPDSPRLVANFRLPLEQRGARAEAQAALPAGRQSHQGAARRTFIPPESLPPQLSDLEWVLLHQGLSPSAAEVLGVRPTLKTWQATEGVLGEHRQDKALGAWMRCFSERLGEVFAEA